MTSSLLAWSVVALLVFWAVGAYNRLMRLRSEVHASFLELQAQLQQQTQLASFVMPSPEHRWVTGEPAFLDQIQGASSQLAACLDAGRPRPLDHERVAALAAAAAVLDRAWERAEREDVHDLAGPQLPDTITESRVRLVRQTQAAARKFNEAVTQYNRAIAQFPALLLAWIFGFKPGRPF